MKAISKLRPGDLVEVKSAAEILQTLDSEGTAGYLPFMPEMLDFCGRRFRVFKRALKTCVYVDHSDMRKFPVRDVVVLEGLRCSGAAHDGCQKGCTIFWRECWLRKVEKNSVQAIVHQEAGEKLRARLKTRTDAETYFCQASELLKATSSLSRRERFLECFSEIAAGNSTPAQMAKKIAIWMFWKIRRALLGTYGRGRRKFVPSSHLNLQPGQTVKVKTMSEITDTLNERACNRGLYFMPDMRQLCGQNRRVERRIEKIITDGTGKMRILRDTVHLEGSQCGCSHVAFGGCPRAEFAYWREDWLQAEDGHADAELTDPLPQDFDPRLPKAS